MAKVRDAGAPPSVQTKFDFTNAASHECKGREEFCANLIDAPQELEEEVDAQPVKKAAAVQAAKGNTHRAHENAKLEVT